MALETLLVQSLDPHDLQGQAQQGPQRWGSQTKETPLGK